MKVLTINKTIDSTTESETVDVEQTSYYCPHCGARGLYREVGDGDHDKGSAFYCFCCRYQFFLEHWDDHYVSSMVLTEKQKETKDVNN